MAAKRELTAPCGLDCFNCIIFEGNITDEVANMVSGKLGVSPAEVPCRGCRQQNGCRLFGDSCATLDCVKEKGIGFCFECDEFPCEKLQPVADGAEFYPHNMKLFNLCRMRKVGVDKWAEEESVRIRRKYFEGRFVVGSGPVID